MDFEWDQAKAESNLRKHGISFSAATGVFDDAWAIERPDARNDYGEGNRDPELKLGVDSREFILDEFNEFARLLGHLAATQLLFNGSPSKE